MRDRGRESGPEPGAVSGDYTGGPGAGQEIGDTIPIPQFREIDMAVTISTFAVQDRAPFTISETGKREGTIFSQNLDIATQIDARQSKFLHERKKIYAITYGSAM